MAIPPTHSCVCERSDIELVLALLNTRDDLEYRISLLDQSGKSYNSLVPIERFGFVVHEILVGACSWCTFLISLGALCFRSRVCVITMGS